MLKNELRRIISKSRYANSFCYLWVWFEAIFVGERIFHTYLLKLCLRILMLSSFYEDDTTDLQSVGHVHLVIFLELRENLC